MLWIHSYTSLCLRQITVSSWNCTRWNWSPVSQNKSQFHQLSVSSRVCAKEPAPGTAFMEPKLSSQRDANLRRYSMYLIGQYPALAWAQLWLNAGFCHRTALTIFPLLTLAFWVMSLQWFAAFLIFCFYFAFCSFFHRISLRAPRNLPFRSILNIFSSQQTIQSPC
jgi:hypothetical protein